MSPLLYWHCLKCGDHEPVQPTGGEENYAVGDSEPCITCGHGMAYVMTVRMAAFYEQAIATGMNPADAHKGLRLLAVDVDVGDRPA